MTLKNKKIILATLIATGLTCLILFNPVNVAAAPGGKSISFPNTYTVAINFPVGASTSANGFVLCSSGDKVLSGGVLVSTSGIYVSATTPYPGAGTNPVAWYGAVENTNILSGSFNVYALCADFTP